MAETVRIARIDTWAINYPVTGRFKFFENTQGRPTGRPSIVIKLTAENGAFGWGQSVPTPRWSYETLESVLSTIDRYLAPELIGREIGDRPALWAAMNQAIAPGFSLGQPICKAGVELALADLAGRIAGRPAVETAGAAGRDRVELSWTLNPRSLEELEQSVAVAHERGYRHFNLKVAPDPALDLELCRRLRTLAGSGHVWVDANGGYDEASAVEIAPRLADLGIAAFEQPLAANRLAGYKRLKRLAALPILMDEGIITTVELEEFAELGLLDGVAVKVARSGGLAETGRIIDVLHERGLLFYASGLTDPDVSLAASLAIFAARGLAVPAALNGPQYLTTSILRQPIEVASGVALVPPGPGLGVEVDEQKLREHELPPEFYRLR
ncbi:MAG TPA: enolase C-terminal domain-like protein [Pirellulales bacterium]|nr:enolase C-terminal domain-like protein [Pirellulales bacterium]